MSYFLAKQNLALNSQAVLLGEEASHVLLSRRIKVGEYVEIQGQDGKRFNCQVVDAQKKSLSVLPKKELVVPVEPEVSVSLFQASVSENAWDFILQKSTELGVAKIYLFSSQNTPKKITADDFEKKLPRWQKILWESAKQSGRGRIPELVFLNGLHEVIEKSKSLDVLYLCDASGSFLKPITYNLKPIGFLIGPEGGFTEQEVAKIKELKNCKLLKLSNFTLRAETAVIAGVAKIVN